MVEHTQFSAPAGNGVCAATKSYFKKRGSPKNHQIFWGRGGSGGTYAVFGASRKRSMCRHAKVILKKGGPRKIARFFGEEEEVAEHTQFSAPAGNGVCAATKSYLKKRGPPKNRQIFWGRGGSGGTYAVFGASRKRSMCSHFRRARVVELVDTRDLKSLAISVAHGFESRPAHQVGYWILDSGGWILDGGFFC